MRGLACTQQNLMKKIGNQMVIAREGWELSAHVMRLQRLGDKR